VGEIRDAETARIAVRASMTGHLVLSTMHTRDAKGAIYRLNECNPSQGLLYVHKVCYTFTRFATNIS
jgi:competence protein ComGA